MSTSSNPAASPPAPAPGSIAWHDLTVPDAPRVRDFYASVVGWKIHEVDMGGYADFSMLDSAGNGVAGVCHSRGLNADIPPQWLMYIIVSDLEASLGACRALGGAVLVGPKAQGSARYAVIRDPAGAVCALYQP